MLWSWANHAVSWNCVSFLCTMMEGVIKSVERGNATTYGKACHRCWSGMDGYDEQVQVRQFIFPLTPHLTDPEARALWREKNCTVLQEHRIVNIYHETWQTRFATASILNTFNDCSESILSRYFCFQELGKVGRRKPTSVSFLTCTSFPFTPSTFFCPCGD